MSAFSRLVVRRKVVVNFHDGRALEGILFKQSGPLLVLKNATLLELGSEPLPIDGDAVVERNQVLFIQAL